MAGDAVTAEKRCDILGLGCSAVDDLIYVDRYPAADAKVPVKRWERHCGGLTATALVAAARLGARSAYASTLGTDDLSIFVVERMLAEGVDVSLLARRPEARPVHSFVVVDEEAQTRNIFFDLRGVVGATEDWPAAEIIRATRVLFVDHVGVAGMIRAARIARAAGIPVVGDLERDEALEFANLLRLVDHLILSQSVALKLTDESDPGLAARKLWTSERSVVAVTCGAAGCWYVAEDHPDDPRHQPAFPVSVVDTTGCGDVFHGAYAAALAQGMDVEERLRFASAAAALKATQRGGQAGIPGRATVDAFLLSFQFNLHKESV